MRANVLTDWETLHMMDVPKPVPGEGKVLIRVLYAGVCGSDITVFHHRHLTATVPRIMCHEILGWWRKSIPRLRFPIRWATGLWCTLWRIAASARPVWTEIFTSVTT